VAALLFYLGLGALLTAEEAGVFLLPGDITLVAVGVQSGTHGAWFFALIAWVVASCAMILGASALYHGVKQSEHTSKVLPRRVRTLVRRHHVWGVAAARMVPGLRNATVFAAAAADLRYRTFMTGLIPATFAWSGALLLIGWYGGDAIMTILGKLEAQPAVKWGSIALVLCAIAFALYRIRSVRHSPEHIAPHSHESAHHDTPRLIPFDAASVPHPVEEPSPVPIKRAK
jgi:membrane protein DedA with SNARE-associated domain